MELDPLHEVFDLVGAPCPPAGPPARPPSYKHDPVVSESLPRRLATHARAVTKLQLHLIDLTENNIYVRIRNAKSNAKYNWVDLGIGN